LSKPNITVCIPTIPPRKALLERAITSVKAQSLPASNVIVASDTARSGAASTRHRALEAVTTEWTAFLDDDDEFYSPHLDVLMRAQQDTGADYVYSWYDVIGGTDPLPHFGKPFDHCNPHQTTITVLVRTELAQEAGFLVSPKFPTLPPDGNACGEDWLFTLRCIELGGYIHHTPYRTWAYHHDSGNTSGRPERWLPEPQQQLSYPDVVYPRKLRV
jgi:glycosyltransferase involved in cell wall biosynthesis